MVAELLGVDPFDQPAVEEGKVLARECIKKFVPETGATVLFPPAAPRAMKILFVASEAYPLVKTGWPRRRLRRLPPALKRAGGRTSAVAGLSRRAPRSPGPLKPVATFALVGAPAPVTLLEGVLPGTRACRCGWWIARPPSIKPDDSYLDEHGQPWHDNALRFALLARAAKAICAQAGRPARAARDRA